MATRYITTALSGLIIVLLGAALLSGGSDEASDAPQTSLVTTAPTLEIVGSNEIPRGDELTLSAITDTGEVDEVSWSLSTSTRLYSGATFTFAPEDIGPVEVTAEIRDQYGRRTVARHGIDVVANPLDADDDGDGLTNRDEVALGTDRANPDTDGDLLDDFLEQVLGSDPLAEDSDADGMTDSFEHTFMLDLLSDDAADDRDGDGFDNLAEFVAASNPRNARFTPEIGVPTVWMTDDNTDVATTDGLTLEFAATTAVRSTTTVPPASGRWYFEIATDATTTAMVGVVSGEATSIAAVDIVGANEVGPSSTLGVIVDASTQTTSVRTVRLEGTTAVLGEPINVDLSTSIAIAVAADAGSSLTLNAGDNPVGEPFAFGPHYLLYNEGVADAEFMSVGWGLVNGYLGPESVETVERVSFEVGPGTGAGIQVGDDGLTLTYDADSTQKHGILANQGMIGEFRYWEASRLTVTPSNLGQGLVARYAELDPYPGAIGDEEPSQPGMSVNSLRGIWQYPITLSTYDTANTTYGFAVDYTGSRPVVYVIIGDELAETVELDIFTAVYPLLYGTPQEGGWLQQANFGDSPFAYDAASILVDAGIDTTAFVNGWGPHTGVAADPGDLAFDGDAAVGSDTDE